MLRFKLNVCAIALLALRIKLNFDQLRILCCVLIRDGHSADSFANSANFANCSTGNAVAIQPEDLPAVVAKSLDEWVERTSGKVTPNCFLFFHRQA